MKTLQIQTGTVITVRGDIPLVVVAEEIVIAGRLDAGATRSDAGPGTSLLQYGGAGDYDAANVAGGGGGGGTFGGTGGIGGSGFSTLGGSVNGGAAAPTYDDAQLDTLIGGSNGGASPCSTAAAGGGGGAIQLSATQRIEIAGTVNAGGGGGRSCAVAGGGGGGSGGAIYLESPVLVGSGLISAGGGGGGGGSTTQGQGADGADAVDDFNPAGGAGFTGAGAGGYGSSGYGGAVGGNATGAGGTGVGESGGGGGGGAGRIVVNGMVSVIPDLKFAPTPTTGL